MNVNLKINDRPVTVDAGSTILEAAEKLDIKIPTLCHFKMDCFHVEHRSASCRICVVEVKGRPNLAPACSTPVMEGMEVKTNTLRAINARRTILDLLLSDHPKDCLTSCPCASRMRRSSRSFPALPVAAQIFILILLPLSKLAPLGELRLRAAASGRNGERVLF